MWLNLQRWRGIILVGLAVVATVWLTLANELQLYIHPRYIVFTVIMAALALVFVIAAVASKRRTARTHDHDHDHEDDVEVPAPGWPRALSLTAVGAAGALAVAMVVLPPATLTSATADQRDINSTALSLGSQDLEQAASASTAAFEGFTVVDWASLLRQTTDLSFYAEKPVSISGFIVPDTDDPENVFYVSRFVVTCCAVDAQPTGVPVYVENWASEFSTDDWVEIDGGFVANPSQSSAQPIVVDPTGITPIEQPSDPYLY